MSSFFRRVVRACSAGLFVGATLLAAFAATCGPAAAQAKKKVTVDPKDVYGDQGGEKTLAASYAKMPTAIMRARAEDTFLKLSNPRMRGVGYDVDYDVISRGKFDGGLLVLRSDDGGKTEIKINITGKDNGTISVGVSEKGQKLSKGAAPLPKIVEMYVVRTDDLYDPSLRCLVSNVVSTGKLRTTSKPRDWTADELVGYGIGPRAYKDANAPPGVGIDVPGIMRPTFGVGARYVDPDGKLLGVDYLPGSWANRARIGQIVPVFDVDQTKQHTARILARQGYAVSGAEAYLEENTFIYGMRLIFSRVQANGTYDLKDSYKSNWIGSPAPEGKSTTFANDGRRVVGISLRRIAVVDQLALVVVESEKK